MEKGYWNIKDVKKCGRKILNNNKTTLIMVSLFITIIFGGNLVSRNIYSSVKKVIQNIQNIQAFKQIQDEKQIVYNGLERFIYSITPTDFNNTVKEYNEKNKVYAGFIFSAFNFISKSETEIQNFVKVISNDETKYNVAKGLFIIFICSAILIKILFINPIVIGEKRLFLESINYKKTKFSRMAEPFRRNKYVKTVNTILTVNIYQILWNLTIIGGCIKHYSYLMVPYIVAENPNMEPKDAINISKNMMNGNKYKAFLLDLNFLWWDLLSILTLGLVGLYYNPYYLASFTALYSSLREQYIKEKNYKFELLNDEKLFSNLDEKETYNEEKSKKKETTIFRTYDILDIILMFFVFSVAGWLIEMNLFYFLERTIVNRGALYGPWIPIYGFGCIAMILIINVCNKYSHTKVIKKIEENPFIIFIFAFVLCTVLEYVTSYVMEKYMGLKYWDYKGNFLNINGRICLENSLFFGAGGCLCIYIIAPFLKKQFSKIPIKTRIIIASMIVVLMMGDSIYAHIKPHTGEHITEELTKQQW